MDVLPLTTSREMKGGRAIDLQHLMACPQPWGAFIQRFNPLPPGTDVGGMATACTEAMQSTAANIALSDVRDRGEGVLARKKAEMIAAWQEREAAGELLRADPANLNLRRTLEAAGKRLKRVRFETVQRFFEEFVSQLEVRIKDGDQGGFYKHLKGMDLEGRISCSVQYIKDEEGRLLRDMEHNRDRWVQ